MLKMSNGYLIRVVLAGLLAIFLFQTRFTKGDRTQPVTSAHAASPHWLQQPIESIEVGQRVLARNPELTSQQAEVISEPDWSNWLRIELELSLADGHEPMQVELLRPEQWIRERMEYSVQPTSDVQTIVAGGDLKSDSALCLRDWFADEQVLSEFCKPCGMAIVDRYLRLDLSDMGAVGLAKVVSIAACPQVSASAGCVVTGTFSNPAAEPILDVSLGSSNQSSVIGVTCTHPFWSVDRQEFVPIDQLPVGARLLDADGHETIIASKLPRPGPQSERVFNLEVFGQHVYFVGSAGVVVHNRCVVGDLGEHGAKGWLERHGYTDVHSFQNSSGHGIDLFARHRDGTLTFFEVKTSTGTRAPALSKAQQNPFNFITSRLQRAWNAGPWWSRTPKAVQNKAGALFNDLTTNGAKYRRYVIEITSAGNGAAPTTFRILPWP